MGDRETGKIEGGRGSGGGRERAEEGSSKRVGKGENRGTIMQQCLIFRNLKGLKRRSQEKRGGRFGHPCPPSINESAY